MMGIQDQAGMVRYRKKANDIFFTPERLAKKCIDFVPVKKGDIVLDNASGGSKVFLNNFPRKIESKECNITSGSDFLQWNQEIDWIITNPPYSILYDYLMKSCEFCRKGFAYLIAQHGLTPKRIEDCQNKGFHISHIHLCKVSRWFGMTNFVIWEKGAPIRKPLFTYCLLYTSPSPRD